MLAVRRLVHTLRWRFIPLRYAGKAVNYLKRRPTLAGRTKATEQLRERGFMPGPVIPAATLSEIRAIYQPRAADVVPTKGGHPFANLFGPADLLASNPVFRFALSEEVLGAAHDYFGGRLLFDSIQVLYSWPTDGELHESQMWHRDFGDRKSLHCIAYVNDVHDAGDGPFVFVDRGDARRIGRSPLIRRIPDDRFARELGGGKIRAFYGGAGEAMLVDPASCYHYGSRCKGPRLAIFVTFNTDRPFVPALPMIREHREKAVAAALEVRPDLAESYLRRLFAHD